MLNRGFSVNDDDSDYDNSDYDDSNILTRSIDIIARQS
ncbi:MAG: hypothetical protein ACI9LE_000032 [Paraglaciecola sp.]|jgi:hypothetical protein